MTFVYVALVGLDHSETLCDAELGKRNFIFIPHIMNDYGILNEFRYCKICLEVYLPHIECEERKYSISP